MNMKNFASYAVFETKTGAPLGTIDSKEAGSAAKAKKLALDQARRYERETGDSVYVTESKLPAKFTVPMMETRVIHGKRKTVATAAQRRKKLGLGRFRPE